MNKVVQVSDKRIKVRTMTAQEMRDYAKTVAAALEARMEGNFLFETKLSQHPDAMIQQLSAELVKRGIPELPFEICCDQYQDALDALECSDDLDDPARLVEAWEAVNPHFLSRAKARQEDVVFCRLMSKWRLIKSKSEEAGKDAPVQ